MSKRTRLRSAICCLGLAGLSIFGGSVYAQVDTICGAGRSFTQFDLEAALTGLYSVELGPGYVVAGGMTIAHPAQADPDFGRIEWSNGQLSLVPLGGTGVALDLDWVEGETWRFDQSPSLPEGIQVAPNQTLPILPYDSESLGERIGCPINDLPRLVGTSDVAVDGVVVHFTYRFMVVSFRQLVGFQEVRATAHGIPVFERRPVRLLMQFDPTESE